MGTGGRHHLLPVPNQQPGRAEEETLGGAQEAAEASSAAAKPNTTDTAATQVSDPG
jgi:hypothetical protein